jgi:hypothetical protein
MVLPMANKIDPDRPLAAKAIRKQQIEQINSLLVNASVNSAAQPITEDTVTPNILNNRNRHVIKRFGERM